MQSVRAKCGWMVDIRCTESALREVAARMNAAVAELYSSRSVDSVLRKQQRGAKGLGTTVTETWDTAEVVAVTEWKD